MPVKWSTVKVKEVAEKVQGYLDQASVPLAEAKKTAEGALAIENLPDYMGQHFRALAFDIARARDHMSDQLSSIERGIPKDQLAHEKKRQEEGETGSLI